MISENKTAVTLGSFDGLHRGHMSVIACAFELQRERGLSPLVLLFDSHPMLTIMGKAPSMILQTELRDKLLSDLGAKTCIVPFA